MLILVAFQAFLLLHLFSVTTTSASHANAIPFPTSEHNSRAKLPLVHRDKLSFSRHNDYRSRFEARMRRDARRVASLTRRLPDGGAGDHEVADLRADVVRVSGEYVVMIGVGSPASNQSMVIDTDSDLLWVQCKPCSQCFHQSDPVYDPARSASFYWVPCDNSDDPDSLLCYRVDEKNRGCDKAHGCTYRYPYVDGAYTEGTLALETLTIGPTAVQNVTIGCGHRNNITTFEVDGVLGLGGGSLSIVAQSGGQIGGAFSYCLTKDSLDGWLEFGRSTYPTDAMWVPLLRNLRRPSSYYIRLLGLGVDNVRLTNIPEDTFRLSLEKGDGGVIMDTGTTITRLPSAAYKALRDRFKAEMGNMTQALPHSILDTCYYLNGHETTPRISFFFSDNDGPNAISYTTKNLLLQADVGVFCFAFAPSSSNVTIIGSIHQQGVRITIDATNGYVGFGPDVC